jgi:hypothetical protein
MKSIISIDRFQTDLDFAIHAGQMDVWTMAPGLCEVMSITHYLYTRESGLPVLLIHQRNPGGLLNVNMKKSGLSIYLNAYITEFGGSFKGQHEKITLLKCL